MNSFWLIVIAAGVIVIMIQLNRIERHLIAMVDRQDKTRVFMGEQLDGD